MEIAADPRFPLIEILGSAEAGLSNIVVVKIAVLGVAFLEILTFGVDPIKRQDEAFNEYLNGTPDAPELGVNLFGFRHQIHRGIGKHIGDLRARSQRSLAGW